MKLLLIIIVIAIGYINNTSVEFRYESELRVVGSDAFYTRMSEATH